MPEHRVLVVEDDEAIRTGLADALEEEGFEVLLASDGGEGLEKGLREDPDLIVLDVVLPGLDGFEVLRRLRADRVATPVLMLTARGLEHDRVKGLDLGADDYVVKPFALAELLARIRSRIRAWDRERGRIPGAALRFGETVVDFAARTARRGEQDLGLTPTEFALLEVLARHEGQAVSRERLLAEAWRGEEVTRRVVDTAMLGLRRKVEPDPASPRFLHAVRGLGYRFQRRP